MDIFPDTAVDKLPDHTFRVETDRFGPFAFQRAVDMSEGAAMLACVEDAHIFSINA